MVSKRKIQSNSDVVDTLLDNRAVKSSQEKSDFFNPPHPMNMPCGALGLKKQAIEEAVKLVKKHVGKKNKIVVWGDYDVDGICSTAIVWENIFSTYQGVFPYIPHRMAEGYGLTVGGVDHVIDEGAKLLIAVDNGIVANSQVEYCRKRGCDVIIIDHHQSVSVKPDANVLLHSKATCAAGLSWVFCRELNKDSVKGSLELAGMAVICDMVSVMGASRSFAAHGLSALNSTIRPGLQELITGAGLGKDRIGTYEVGFVLGPRLNAMGRLEHGIDSLRLLCTKSRERARQLAYKLGEVNQLRQNFTQTAFDHASEQIDHEHGGNVPALIWAADNSYHQGVIGLVAAKLVEKYNRPTVVVSLTPGLSKASARSVAGFDITSYLRRLGTLLTEVGGHSMAAGFSFRTVDVDTVKSKAIEVAEKSVDDLGQEKKLRIDCQIPIEMVKDSLVDEIERFSPFGLGNPQPSFMSAGVKVDEVRVVGKTGRHLKLRLGRERWSIEAIAFNFLRNWGLERGASVDVVFQLRRETWNGQNRIQMLIKESRKTE